MVSEHQAYVNRLVQRLVGWDQPASVDDIVQDVFVAAWEKRATLRGQSQPRTWLTRIAINKTRNHQRKLRTMVVGLLRFWQAQLEATSQQFAGLLGNRPSNVGTAMLRKQVAAMEWGCVELARRRGDPSEPVTEKC